MSYLIKDTTPEERIQIVEKALSISLSGAEPPTEEVLELVNEYIDGKKEIDEILSIVIAKYKKEGLSE